MIAELFGSKKASVTILGVLAIVAVCVVALIVRPDLAEIVLPAALAAVAGLAGTYNIGQGIADKNATPPPTP